jgi:hypothetical protein
MTSRIPASPANSAMILYGVMSSTDGGRYCRRVKSTSGRFNGRAASSSQAVSWRVASASGIGASVSAVSSAVTVTMLARTR